jgi:hypothetical protein
MSECAALHPGEDEDGEGEGDEEGDGDGDEGAAFGMGDGEELTPAQAAMLAHFERLLAAGGPVDGEPAPGQFDDAPEEDEEEGAGEGN